MIEKSRRRALAYESSLSGEGCQNPNCRKPFAGTHGDFNGSGSDRRCQNCYVYRLRTGVDRPASVMGRRANNVREGCRNPACLADWTEEGKFVGSGEDSRCRGCYDHRKKTGTDRSADLVAASRNAALARAANKAREGCKNPDCLREFDGKIRFYGHGAGRRCDRCKRRSRRLQRK
jgi:hypothetical protein